MTSTKFPGASSQTFHNPGSMTNTNYDSSLICCIDKFTAELEDDGYTMPQILDAFTEYVEICDDLFTANK